MDPNKLLIEFNQKISKLLSNELLSNGLKIFTVLYAVFLVDSLGDTLLNLYNNPLVRLLVVAMIAVLAKHDPVLAILITICFVLTMCQLNKTKVENLPLDEQIVPDAPTQEVETYYNEVEDEMDTPPDTDIDHSKNDENQETFYNNDCAGSEFSSNNQLETAQNGGDVSNNGDIATWKNQASAQGGAMGDVEAYSGSTDGAIF